MGGFFIEIFYQPVFYVRPVFIFASMLMSWGALIFYAFVVVTAIQLFYYLFFFRR